MFKQLSRCMLFIVASSAITISTNANITKSKHLNMLLDDWKLYKFDDKHEATKERIKIQSGNHYQHSLWVHLNAQKLVDDSSPYASLIIKLNDRDKHLFALAALLHDVGKAGIEEHFEGKNPDLKYDIIIDKNRAVSEIRYKFDQALHCQLGFEQIGGKFFSENEKNFKKRSYILANGKTFNFDAMFKELKVSDTERKLIAILIGMHFWFGDLKQGTMTADQFIEKLQIFVDTVDYNKKAIDLQLLGLSILIQIADVCGLSPCKECCTSVINKTEEIKPVRETPFVPYKRFGYEVKDNTSDALEKMNKLIVYYVKKTLKV